MQLAIYAHPFDLEALAPHGGLRRLRDLGFDEIALATSYHAGRWLQPWHPAGRVRFLEDGTVHFRPRGDYGLLQPKTSSCVPANGPSPLERLCAEAPRAGLAVRAWTVCTHNSRLGALHPELCIQNAFGDRYPYALCPAQPAVQQYVLALARDLAAHEGLGAIEFEALGWMGWKHSSHHDKASFVPRGLLEYALSLCFCDACVACLEREEGDAEATRRWARDLVTQSIEGADAMAPATVLERIDSDACERGDPATVAAEEALWGPRSARITTLAGLGRTIRAALPANVRAAVQVHPAMEFAGSQVPIPQTQGLRADEYVFTSYGEKPAAVERLLRGETSHLIEPRGGRTHGKRVSIWPKAPEYTSDADLAAVRDLAAAHGVGSLAIYHLGLLPWRTIERVAKICRA